MRELANTAAWLDTLYGRCRRDDGEIVVVSPARNRIASVHTVGDGLDLVAAAKAMHKHPGCYLKVNLMDYAAMYDRAAAAGKMVIGQTDEVKTVVSIHLDVDAGKGAKYLSRKFVLFALSQMPLHPTMVINSNGGTGGFHVYWVLREPVRVDGAGMRKELAKVSKSWEVRLRGLLQGKLDSTSNLDRVLRCVGVPRLDGGRVCLHDCDFSRAYQLEDFNGQ